MAAAGAGGKLLYATCSRIPLPKTRHKSILSGAAHPDALRETITFPPGARYSGGTTLAFGFRSGPQSRRVFSYRCFAKPDAAIRPHSGGAARRRHGGAHTLRSSSGMPVHSRHSPSAFERGRRNALRILGALMTAIILSAVAGSRRRHTAEGGELRIDEGDLLLSAEFDLALTPTLEEALQKGIPLYFTIEFDLTRARWYWVDEKVAEWSITYEYRIRP
jgi:hypothetical protein